MPKGPQVLVLCGGKGTRLKEFVWDRPKPMATIKKRPFLDILLSYLHRQGVGEIFLSVGYMASNIHQYYHNRNLPFSLTIIEEPFPLGTAGAVKYCEKFIDSPFFFVCNGDSFCPFDLNKMIQTYKERSPLAVLGLIRSKEAGGYGLVKVDKDSGAIISFREKGGMDEGEWIDGRALINGGVYLFSEKIFNEIPRLLNISLELELFPRLLMQRKTLMSQIEDVPLLDIGTGKRLEKAKLFFEGDGVDFGYAFNDQ